MIFDRPESLFSDAEFTLDFRIRRSAHEAGHATLGLSLGARIEGVYARIDSRLPNGNFRVKHFTNRDPTDSALGLKAKVLFVAGGAAGEALLTGDWDEAEVNVDRYDLKRIGVFNFQYCAEQASELLERNRPVLISMSERLKERMSNMRELSFRTGSRSDVVLLSGNELRELFNEKGSPVDCTAFDLDKACNAS